MGLPSPSGLVLAPSSLQLIDPGGFLSVEKKAPNWDKGPALGRAEPLQPSLDVERGRPAGLSLLILSQVKWCLLIPSALLSPTLTTGMLTSHLR